MVLLLTIGGRIAKGFDFLGYSFEPKGLSIAPKTLANFLDRIAQLYEPGAPVAGRTACSHALRLGKPNFCHLPGSHSPISVGV